MPIPLGQNTQSKTSFGESEQNSEKRCLGRFAQARLTRSAIDCPKSQLLPLASVCSMKSPAKGFLDMPKVIWSYNGKYMGELKTR